MFFQTVLLVLNHNNGLQNIYKTTLFCQEKNVAKKGVYN